MRNTPFLKAYSSDFKHLKHYQIAWATFIKHGFAIDSGFQHIDIFRPGRID
jgi:hypothetical protein